MVKNDEKSKQQIILYTYCTVVLLYASEKSLGFLSFDVKQLIGGGNLKTEGEMCLQLGKVRRKCALSFLEVTANGKSD